MPFGCIYRKSFLLAYDFIVFSGGDQVHDHIKYGKYQKSQYRTDDQQIHIPKTKTTHQDFFDQNKDYIERDSDGNIIGLWADYYDSNIEPTDPDTPSPAPSNTYGKITASTSTIKVGGSYKTFTVKLYDADNNDVTDDYSSATFDWTCYIKGNETDDLSDKVTWLNGSLFNQKKIKFPDDRSYLNQILIIKCVIDGIETVEEFELIA